MSMRREGVKDTEMKKKPQVVQEKITSSTGGEKWKFVEEETESDVNTREGR